MYPMLHQSITLPPTISQNNNICKHPNQRDLYKFSLSHLPQWLCHLLVRMCHVQNSVCWKVWNCGNTEKQNYFINIYLYILFVSFFNEKFFKVVRILWHNFFRSHLVCFWRNNSYIESDWTVILKTDSLNDMTMSDKAQGLDVL